jgi:hypothetical protein
MPNSQLTPRRAGLGALTRADIADFQRALDRVVSIIGRFNNSLTPREKLILQLGLRGAHLEEALAHGETQRAADHERAAVTIAQALSVK